MVVTNQEKYVDIPAQVAQSGDTLNPVIMLGKKEIMMRLEAAISNPQSSMMQTKILWENRKF